MYKSILTAAFVATMSVVQANATEIRTTTSPDALCNDGTQATYNVQYNGSNNWAVVLAGGGVVTSPDQYQNRRASQPRFTTADNVSRPNFQQNDILHDMKDRGYNILYLPYCSSDIWQGNHEHEINGEVVQFRGRAIIENVAAEMSKELFAADEVVFIGYSAGAIGLGFNSDLISKLEQRIPMVRVVVDSFWFDVATKDWYANVFTPNNKESRRWLYKNLPEHCGDDPLKWYNCFPSRDKFEQMGIDNVFLIWNVGDPYARPVDQNKFKSATIADINFYGAGVMIDANKRGVNGFQPGGHVLTFMKDTYRTKFGDKSVRDAINNWLDDSMDVIIIDK